MSNGSGSAPRKRAGIRRVLAPLIRHPWQIAAIACVTYLIALIYSLHAPPVFKSDLLIQVDGSSGAPFAGASLFGGSGDAAAEGDIILSRSVLGAVVDRLGLDIEARPLHFPLIGRVIARFHDGAGIARPWLGLDDYAWGGEKIQIDTLKVPANLRDVPLILKADGTGRYRVLDNHNETLVAGVVGTGASAKGDAVRILVGALEARPGTRFELMKMSRLEAIKALKDRLRLSEKGKETGVLELQLEGTDPANIAATLNAIGDIYVRQGAERRAGEAGKILETIQAKLPVLKAQLEAANTRLDNFRSRVSGVEPNLEDQKRAEQAVATEKRIDQLDARRSELSARFTPRHPVLIALAKERATLESQLTGDSQIAKTPVDTRRAIELETDAGISRDLYSLFLNKAQELEIVRAEPMGTARIVDAAVEPHEAAARTSPRFLLASLALGIAAGCLFVIVRHRLIAGVDDPVRLENETGIPTYVIPHSVPQRRQSATRKGKTSQLKPLAAIDENDDVVETILGFSAVLSAGLSKARNNIIVLAGPSQGTGKSFLAANLAVSFVEAGKRTLLIDADLRKGDLHRYFGADGDKNGLCDVVRGTTVFSAAIRRTGHQNLFFLPRGTVPPHPAEVLLSARFEKLLTLVSGKFDVVIVDTPPVLPFTDAAIVGEHAGMNFLVIQHGRHEREEIELVIKRLRQSGIEPNGIVFNDARSRSRNTGQIDQYHSTIS